MTLNESKIALGGGCHWCTEAVFQSLLGVIKVEQGYVASIADNSSFSEAVVVYFNSEEIAVKTLIEIHLYTHKSTSNHSMRNKYRSAVYTFSACQKQEVDQIIATFYNISGKKLITQVFPFHTFKASRVEITNYYYNNPKKPFCDSFIIPKLKLLLDQFSSAVDSEKLKHLK